MEITLIFRTEAGEWSPVCSDSWNSSWSGKACRQLGMAGDQGTEAVVDMDIHDEEFWYVDENMPSAKHPVQRFSEKRENMNCQSKANVEVECQHFSKYINV